MTINKHYLLVAAATPTGEHYGTNVTLAITHVSRDQVERWGEHAGIVSALSRGGVHVYKIAAWCAVDFYEENPIAKDHPAYDEVASVMEDRDCWCLVDEDAFDTSGESVRTDTDHVDVWAADLVFCGRSKYGSDRYESTWININDLRAALIAKA